MPEAGKRSAFAVHILTASGAAIAFLAMQAAVERDWSAMFLWLGLALVVDGIDGPMARKLRVVTLLPRWSDVLAIPAGLAIVVTAALYFADRQMKTDDNYFRGFPALWNAAAFYLILLPPVPWLGAAFVAVLLIATFLPFPFVHPVRVRRLRGLTILLLVAWAILALYAITQGMKPNGWVTAALCAIAVYVLAAGALRKPA